MAIVLHVFSGFKPLFACYQTGRDRTNYLLVKEAKIIAMTCTHAALKRRDLVELGFKVCRISHVTVILRRCSVL